MNYPLILGFFIFFTGACFGSFLMLVADRYETGESIVFKSSFCNKCNSKLSWWQNIPLFGYLFLRGKCYFCKNEISSRYFFSELITGVITSSVFMIFMSKGLLLHQIVEVILFLYILILLSMFDIKYRIVPHKITYMVILLIFLEKLLVKEPVLILLFNLGAAFIFMDLLHFVSTVIKKFHLKPNLIILPLSACVVSSFFTSKIILSFLFSAIYLIVVFLFEHWKLKLKNNFNLNKINISLWTILFILLLVQTYKSIFIDYNADTIFLLFAELGLVYLICEIIVYSFMLFASKELDKPETESSDEKITIGGGDITFFALISVFLGIKQSFFVLFIASFFAIVSHFILRILPKFKTRNLEYIPFIPYLSIACFIIIIMFYADSLAYKLW